MAGHESTEGEKIIIDATEHPTEAPSEAEQAAAVQELGAKIREISLLKGFGVRFIGTPLPIELSRFDGPYSVDDKPLPPTA